VGTPYYIRSDEIWSLNGAVATSSGTTDSDYTDDWLVDSRPGWPAKATTGTVTWTVTKTGGYVDGIGIFNHNLDAALVVTIGGDVSTTITIPTARPSGIPRNPFKSVTAVASCATLSIAIASNSLAVTIGGFYAGKKRTFPHTGLAVRGLSGSEQDFRSRSGGDDSMMMPYDPRQRTRPLRGSTVCTTAELDDLIAWQESQKGGSLPSILIMDDTANDARLVYMSLSYDSVPNGSGLWEASLAFSELPRVRW
jgi:hypothetical protein